MKAQHDLATARKLATEPDAYLDTAIYHCQQAAEKAVKGYLTFHDEPLHRTHDVELLVRIASAHEPGFVRLMDAAARLTAYATEFRYPGAVLSPSQGEFDQALTDAHELLAFILSRLPAETRPPP